jgi:signal transduction histidine kinase
MAVFSQDRDLRYTWVFRPQLAPPEGVIDKTDLDMLERLRLPAIEKVIAAKRRVLETGVGVRTEIRFGEGADARWYDLAVEPIRDPWGAVVGVTSASLNVSERRRAEERVRESREELRALTARLQSIREEEQARIARDLHDELGQLLTALKMGLRSLEATVGTVDPQNASGVLDRVVAASEMVDQTLSTIRRIATELRPGSLDRLGLVPALRQEIRNFEERTGIPCEASLPEQLPELDPSVATALYRICQEAMTNVHRHATASRVAIRLQMDSSAITLQVEDDGRGFEPTVAGSPQALGLLGMVERAEGLEGHVYFQRADGRRGTLVTASIPVGDAQAGLDRRQAGAAS